MNKKQEQIWRYLNGEMPIEEKEKFEQRLNDTPQLQEALKQEQELIDFLQNKDAKDIALQNLADIHRNSISPVTGDNTPSSNKTELPKQSKNAIIRWIIPIAIAASLAIGYFYFSPEQSTPQELYASHFEPAEISFSTRGEGNEVMLNKVADLFNARSYKSTIGFIEKLPEGTPFQDKILYTKAISLIANQQNAEGRAILDNLPALYGDEASWYRALSFLQEGNPIEAANALRAISPKFNRYEDVNAILEQL